MRICVFLLVDILGGKLFVLKVTSTVQCFQARFIIPTVNLFQMAETEIDSTIGIDFITHLEMGPIGMSTPRKFNTNRLSRKSLKKMFRRESVTSDSSYGTPSEAHPKYFPDVIKDETCEIALKYREPAHYATESNTSDTDSPCWMDQEVELHQERHNPKDRRLSGILQKGGALINNRTKVPSQMQMERIAKKRKVNRNNQFNQGRKEITRESDTTLTQPSEGNSLRECSKDSEDSNSFELNNDLTFLFHDQDEERFDQILKQKESKAPFDVTMASRPLAKSMFSSSKIFYGATAFHSRKLPKVKRTLCRKSSIRLSRAIRLSRMFRKSKGPKRDKITLDFLWMLWNQSTTSIRLIVITPAILFLATLMFLISNLLYFLISQ